MAALSLTFASWLPRLPRSAPPRLTNPPSEVQEGDVLAYSWRKNWVGISAITLWKPFLVSIDYLSLVLAYWRTTARELRTERLEEKFAETRRQARAVLVQESEQLKRELIERLSEKEPKKRRLSVDPSAPREETRLPFFRGGFGVARAQGSSRSSKVPLNIEDSQELG